MNRRRWSPALAFAFSLVLAGPAAPRLAAQATTAAPSAPEIAYEGRLEELGLPVTGERVFRFALLDSTDAALWDSGDLTLQVQSGLYATVLGSAGMPAIDPAILGRAGLRLRVSVGGQALVPDLDMVPDFQAQAATLVTGAFGGDVSGTQNQITVTRLQGVPVDFSVAPQAGQVLLFDGTRWAPGNLGGLAGPQGPQGPQGPPGPTGAAGPAGPQGQVGILGPAGPAGTPGATGGTGSAGNAMLNGSGAPSDAGTGVDGDFYLDTLNKFLYGPKGNSHWPTSGVSVAGASGAPGAAGTNGATGATGATGTNGAAGTDGAAGTTGATGATGGTGAAGNAMLNGSGAPSDAGTGADGDFYLDTLNKFLYGPKGNSHWPTSGVSVVGASGAPGAAGTNGATGATGATGTNGTAGTNGAAGTDGAAGTTGATGATGQTGVQGSQGTAGTNGNTILSGTSDPGLPSFDSTGTLGDFYLKTDTTTLYGPKTGSAWPASGTSLVGPSGQAGLAGASLNPLQIAMQRWYPFNRTGIKVSGLEATPVAMAFDGATIWVASSLGSVTPVNPATRTAGSVLPGPGNARAMIFDGADLWVAGNNGNGVLRVLDANQKTFVTSYAIPGVVIDDLAFDGANLWIATASTQIYRVDLSGGIPAADGNGAPAGMVTYILPATAQSLSFDGSNIWVGMAGRVGRLDGQGYISTYTVGGNHNCLTFDGTGIWAGGGNGTVVKLNLDGSQALQPTAGGSTTAAVTHMVFDGRYLWVSCDNNTITKLDAVTGAQVGPILTLSSAPEGLCFDGANVWVCTFDNELLKL